MTWLNWSLKFHSSLRTIQHLIHTHNTQHTRLLFNECLFHLCDCTCSNVMCILNCLSIKPKNIFEYFICFWKCFLCFCALSFCSNCIFHVFHQKLLRKHFREKLATKLFLRKWVRQKWKHKISDRNFRDCLAIVSWVKTTYKVFYALEAFFMSNFVRS